MTQRGDRPLSDLEASHTPQAVRERLQAGPEHSDLRDFIFGAVDGTVTTFAVVAGVSGAGLAPGIVIVLGVANLVGDGFSMAVSNFLGTRAETQQRQRVRHEERRQIREIPEGEREEVRQIFAEKGFSGADLERVVEVITEDHERWLETMLREEHGFPAHEVSAWRAGVATYIGFMLAGLVPLVPYLFQAIAPVITILPFFWSIILAVLTFFSIGAAKARFVAQRWYLGGLETLIIGGIAAGLAYGIGVLLRGMVDAL